MQGAGETASDVGWLRGVSKAARACEKTWMTARSLTRSPGLEVDRLLLRINHSCALSLSCTLPKTGQSSPVQSRSAVTPASGSRAHSCCCSLNTGTDNEAESGSEGAEARRPFDGTDADDMSPHDGAKCRAECGSAAEPSASHMHQCNVTVQLPASRRSYDVAVGGGLHTPAKLQVQRQQLVGSRLEASLALRLRGQDVCNLLIET
jgi:hypothetical protein